MAGFGHGGTAAGVAVTALSFKTGAGVPLLAAGGGGGVITVWNLEERRLQTVLKDAHDASLLTLHFFPGEPLLMSSVSAHAARHPAPLDTPRAGRSLA